MFCNKSWLRRANCKRVNGKSDCKQIDSSRIPNLQFLLSAFARCAEWLLRGYDSMEFDLLFNGICILKYNIKQIIVAIDYKLLFTWISLLFTETKSFWEHGIHTLEEIKIKIKKHLK